MADVLFDVGLSSVVVCRVFTLTCFPCSVFIPVTIKGFFFFFSFVYCFWLLADAILVSTYYFFLLYFLSVFSLFSL